VETHTLDAIGAPEDSFENCLNLRPRRTVGPSQDLNRFMNHSGDVLRFEAMMVSNEPTDAVRRFIISYFIRDFTIAVYEPPARNSGIVGGTFLKRERLPHPDQSGAPTAHKVPAMTGMMKLDGGQGVGLRAQMPKYYAANDLYVGATVTVHHQKFKLYKCDLFTLQYMEQRPEEFSEGSADAAVQKIVDQLGKDGVERLGAGLGMFGDSGTVDIMQLKGCLAAAGCSTLTDQSIIAVVRRADSGSGGGVASVEKLMAPLRQLAGLADDSSSAY